MADQLDRCGLVQPEVVGQVVVGRHQIRGVVAEAWVPLVTPGRLDHHHHMAVLKAMDGVALLLQRRILFW